MQSAMLSQVQISGHNGASLLQRSQLLKAQIQLTDRSHKGADLDRSHEGADQDDQVGKLQSTQVQPLQRSTETYCGAHNL